MTKLLIRLFAKDTQSLKEPSVRLRCGYLGSITGITLNILLFAGKFIAGLLSGAISVTADAFNNLSDAGSSVLSLAGFKMAAQPADKEHPYGHGRMEYVSGLIISFLIMLMGFELAQTSAQKIFHPKDVTFSALTLVILIVSVLVKLWMWHFYRTLGRMIDSASLRAASADSLSDCAATSAVIAAMLVLYFFDVNIDGYIGAAVALFIIYSGINTFRDSLTPILGAKPDKEFVEKIRKSAESYDSIIGIHDILVHDYGVGNLMVSMHAEIPADMELVAAHDLIDSLENSLMEQFGCLVTIHMDPVAVNDEYVMLISRRLSEIASQIDSRITVHDLHVDRTEDHCTLDFDVLVPYDIKVSDEEIKQRITYDVEKLGKKMYCKITIDKDYD
ncbi:MAG: cation transporter [Ruminococcus sp.]|nr:cation transporter [Ruminococcus sp.]